MNESTKTGKKRRGFACMDPKRVSEIARSGGRAAHKAGTAHEFTREEAREAGRKGGHVTSTRKQKGELPYRIAPAGIASGGAIVDGDDVATDDDGAAQ